MTRNILVSVVAENETEIYADPALPTIKITREFNHPRERVFRAWTDPDLVVRWMGPHRVTMELEHWDARTGGSYVYRAFTEGFEGRFWGSFHEVRPSDRVVQTFSFDGAPDSVSLETTTFDDLGAGRTRVTSLSVVESMEVRDAMLTSGMELGVVEGYQKLGRLLAR